MCSTKWQKSDLVTRNAEVDSKAKTAHHVPLKRASSADPARPWAESLGGVLWLRMPLPLLWGFRSIFRRGRSGRVTLFSRLAAFLGSASQLAFEPIADHVARRTMAMVRLRASMTSLGIQAAGVGRCGNRNERKRRYNHRHEQEFHRMNLLEIVKLSTDNVEFAR